ncbi:hypothetical protein [Moritella sp. 28]|uniref:hypothetical protein n=1 Tax=Moritella sp. 28 TaxID=2746232 RepID=UPI001BADE75B|nr:hypothetical protein [Moritella sp. 28]QUM85205.1 hypothetical protein HWV02_12200 [Moritella sp. 28]
MKLITKIIAVLVTVITLVIAGNYLNQYTTAKGAIAEKKAYMEKVYYMVKHPKNAWTIKVSLPESPDRIQWDAEYEMPRVMFLGKRVESDRSSSLWSMNIDGSDIKLMISNDEVVNMRMRELIVSPDGRYLFANSEYRGFMFKCYLYDLKEQVATYISEDKCTGVHWTDDTNNAIVYNGYGPATFTMTEKKLQNVNELLGYSASSRHKGINAGAGSIMSFDQKKYIQYATEDTNYFHDGVAHSEGDFVTYDAKTFKLIDKLDYYPKGCDHFIYFSIDNSFFTCNKIKSWEGDIVSYTVFDAKPPFKILGEAPALGVLQPNTLYTDYGHFVYRKKRPDENSPINQVKYWYKYNNHSARDIFFYISPNLRDGYNNRDFTSFYPPLPTAAQVSEVKLRIQEGS